MTTRRGALRLLFGLGAFAAAPAARAQAEQAARARRVGYLTLEAPPRPAPTSEQWKQRVVSASFGRLGWNEGRDFVIDRAYADLKAEALPRLAAGLLRRKAELILANGPEAAVAAARATRSVPIVFFNVVWPEEQGLIASFARPGRNVTGVSYYAGLETSVKRIEIMREILPAAKRLSWLWPADYQQTVAGGRFEVTPALDAAARAAGFDLRLHPLRRLEDVDAALAEAAAWNAQALIASSEYALHARARIAEFALRHRLPSAFPSPEAVEAGGLFSYGVGKDELQMLFARCFEYADRILRGARPADLPVERPKRYELVVNQKTALALGIRLPQSVLLRAERVIE